MICKECKGFKYIEHQAGTINFQCRACDGTGEVDGNNGRKPSLEGTGQHNQVAGSPDTSESRKPKKPKAKKKARRKTG